MFELGYNEAKSILESMNRAMIDIDEYIEKLSQATTTYSATIQDDISREATDIIMELRSHIEATKETIAKGVDMAYQAMVGFKEVEDDASEGGLKNI